MRKPLTAAAVQMNSGPDREANLRVASRLVSEAAGGGARLVCLPELFNRLGPLAEVAAAAEPVPGPTSTAMSQLAAQLQITLLAGSICQQSDTPGRVFNTSLLYGPDGRLLAAYRKIHLFDVDLPGDATAPAVRVAESQHFDGGTDVVVAASPSARLGLSICYDLRFPELYRRLAKQGAEVLLIPASFTFTTGRDHWQTLLMARAIENQAFVVAAGQCGTHPPGMKTYGHSQIIDPWGHVLAEASESDEGVILAELDFEELARIRRQLPALAHRRLVERAGE
ncbi:MAG: carbon-nitrogen hydrolase family protein [Planctomycetia bacterium]|nr:carbon-nitrogen hydrolase family protein [Planctomycetia bacterium]